MEKSFENISDINDTKDLWKVAMRVHHKWTILSNNKEHFERTFVNKDVSLNFYVLISVMMRFHYIIFFYLFYDFNFSSILTSMILFCDENNLFVVCITYVLLFSLCFNNYVFSTLFYIYVTLLCIQF